MSRTEMIDYITEQLPAADEYVLEQIFEFLQEVEYWKEVIQISNSGKGGECPIYRTVRVVIYEQMFVNDTSKDVKQ